MKQIIEKELSKKIQISLGATNFYQKRTARPFWVCRKLSRNDLQRVGYKQRGYQACVFCKLIPLRVCLSESAHLMQIIS